MLILQIRNCDQRYYVTYLKSHWFNLLDETLEWGSYDSHSGEFHGIYTVQGHGGILLRLTSLHVVLCLLFSFTKPGDQTSKWAHLQTRRRLINKPSYSLVFLSFLSNNLHSLNESLENIYNPLCGSLWSLFFLAKEKKLCIFPY